MSAPLRTRAVKALGHPLRALLLDLVVAHGENGRTSPSMMAATTRESLGVVSYHVRTLERLGMVELADTKQRRGAIEHYYRATDDGRRVAHALDELREQS